jgi:hypothetical protein
MVELLREMRVVLKPDEILRLNIRIQPEKIKSIYEAAKGRGNTGIAMWRRPLN